MSKLLALGAVVALACFAQAEEASDAVKKEQKLFSGTWKAVSATNDGKKLPKEQAEKITLAVKGDKYTLTTPSGDTVEGTHKLDPSKKPKELDALRSSAKDEKILAIYELTKDTYKVCLAQPGKDRPTEFSSKPGSGHRLMIFKRAGD